MMTLQSRHLTSIMLIASREGPASRVRRVEMRTNPGVPIVGAASLIGCSNSAINQLRPMQDALLPALRGVDLRDPRSDDAATREAAFGPFLAPWASSGVFVRSRPRRPRDARRTGAGLPRLLVAR
jgi:hypothetical protein